MIFFGKGTVWDKHKNKRLCKFSKEGILETNDAYIIEKLTQNNFKAKEEVKDIVKEVEKELKISAGKLNFSTELVEDYTMKKLEKPIKETPVKKVKTKKTKSTIKNK